MGIEKTVDEEILITVIIPTYNREWCIRRALDSLENQTCKAFKCIVVDDGSTDNTREIVEEYQQKASFQLKYIWKENGGTNSAWYTGLKNTDTQFSYSLGSDDELEHRCIETLLEVWNGFTDDEKETYVGICGLVREEPSGVICGGRYPAGINEMPTHRYLHYSDKGERTGMVKVQPYLKIYKKTYEIAQYYHLKFIPEGILNYENIEERRPYYVNKVLRIYYTDSPDSLIHSKVNTEGIRGGFICCLFQINHYFPTWNAAIFSQFKSYVLLIRFALMLKKPPLKVFRAIKSWTNKAIVLLCLPIGVLYYAIKEK